MTCYTTLMNEEVELLIKRDIATAERGLAYFRDQRNERMVEITEAEKKTLERVLDYIRAEMARADQNGITRPSD